MGDVEPIVEQGGTAALQRERARYHMLAERFGNRRFRTESPPIRDIVHTERGYPFREAAHRQSKPGALATVSVSCDGHGKR